MYCAYNSRLVPVRGLIKKLFSSKDILQITLKCVCIVMLHVITLRFAGFLECVDFLVVLEYLHTRHVHSPVLHLTCNSCIEWVNYIGDASQFVCKCDHGVHLPVKAWLSMCLLIFCTTRGHYWGIQGNRSVMLIPYCSNLCLCMYENVYHQYSQLINIVSLQILLKKLWPMWSSTIYLRTAAKQCVNAAFA